MALSVVRYLDLIVLALAAVIFLAAGLPLLGFAVAAVAWLVQRAIADVATRRARATDDPRKSVGLMAGSMLGRGWMVAGAILVVGLVGNRADGLAAAVLCISLFTVYFSAQMIVRPFDMPDPRR